MLLLSEQDFAASGHDSLDANSLVTVTLRQSTSTPTCVVFGANGFLGQTLITYPLHSLLHPKTPLPNTNRSLAG
jgi:hypothetical protein